MSTTLNYTSFERQAPPYKLGDAKPDRNEQIQRFQSHFYNLTEEQHQIIRSVCRFPGSSAKRIGQLVDISRYRALQELKRLGTILTYSEGDKPNSAAKPTFHFSLKEGLTAEVAEFLLDSFPPVQLPRSNSPGRSPKAALVAIIDAGIESSHPLLGAESSSTTSKAAITDVDALLQNSPQGITAKEIAAKLGCKKPTLNTWLHRLIEHDRATREEQPSGEFVYFPRPSQSTRNQESSPMPVHIEVGDTVNSNHHDLDLSLHLSTDGISEANLQELLETIIDHLRDLENRMQSIEQVIHGKKVVRVEKIDAYITDRAKLNGKH